MKCRFRDRTKISHAALGYFNYKVTSRGLRNVFVLAEAYNLSDHEVLDHESSYSTT